MSLIARITDFQPLTPVSSSLTDDELNNIINMLNGTSTDKSIRVRSNDNAFAVARFDQLSSFTKIVEFYSDGAEVANIGKDGKLNSVNIIRSREVWYAPNAFNTNPIFTLDRGDIDKVFIVPAGTSMVVSKITLESAGHFTGSSIRVKLNKNGVDQGSGAIEDDSHPVPQSETLNLSVSSGDRLKLSFTIVNGGLGNDIGPTVSIDWEQKLT